MTAYKTKDTKIPHSTLRIPNSHTPVLMLVLLCGIWGLTFPATKSALTVADPVHFMALRFTLATLIATPLLFIRRSGELPTRRFQAGKWLMGAGVGLLFLLGLALQTFGMRYTTASRSGFFTGLLVVMAPILAMLFRTSWMPVTAWLGVPVALGGIYLLADPALGGLNIGDWLTIGCALACALQMIALEAAAPRIADPWLLTWLQMATISIGTLIWSLIAGAPFHADKTVWLAAGYTGIFGGVIAVWLQTRYQPEVPAGRAALIYTLEPLFAALFAWILLGDVWTMRGLVGAGLILAAMGVSGATISKTVASRITQTE